MYRIAAAVISIIFFVSIPALAELDEIQWRQGLDVRALMPLGSWKDSLKLPKGKTGVESFRSRFSAIR
jgi:hypothetical protein